VRTVLLLVEDEEKLKKRLRAVLPKCPKPALLIYVVNANAKWYLKKMVKC
jgi:hypothetical protein